MATPKTLGKAAFIKAASCKTKVVPIDGLGKVTICEISVSAQSDISDIILKRQTEEGAIASAKVALVIAGLLGPDGKPMFTSDDTNTLLDLSDDWLHLVAEAIRQFNKAEVDTTKGNSASGQTAASSTD